MANHLRPDFVRTPLCLIDQKARMSATLDFPQIGDDDEDFKYEIIADEPDQEEEDDE